MTPTEHYETAERLLDGAREVIDDDTLVEERLQAMRDVIALAQVHATLATANPAHDRSADWVAAPRRVRGM